MSERQKGKQPATDIEGQSHIDMELRSIDNPPAHQVQEAGVQDQSLGEQHVAQRPSIWKIRERHFGQMAKSHQQGSYPYSTGKIVKLLRALCDLQIATGLAIIVAGIGQWDSIDFYHEELVNSYYGLTLNSFWATRVSYMDLESEEDTWALLLRRATVLASSIMSIVWQFRLYFRETASKVWSDDVGPCFRYLDRSNPLFGTIFWPTGLTIFCVALASSLFEQTRWADKWYFLATEWVSQFLWSRFQAALNRDEIVNNGTSTTSRSPPKLLKAILKVMEVLASGLAVTVYFLFLQLLDVWSYGNGFYPLTWLAYFGLYCWNVLDIVSAVLLNRELIQDEEWAWGFGQILPMVLILSVLFLVVDVIRGKSLHASPHTYQTPKAYKDKAALKSRRDRVRELETRRMRTLRQIWAIVKRVPSAEGLSQTLRPEPAYNKPTLEDLPLLHPRDTGQLFQAIIAPPSIFPEK
jgi:hypothetical protein